MSSWLIVAEVAMLKDALRLLSQLSHYFKNKKAILMEAQRWVSNAVDLLCSLKAKNGRSTQRFIDSFTASGTFKYVQLNKNESDEGKFIRTRSQVYQALCVNIRQRFTCTDFLSNIQVVL